ncbi:flagellar biosynthesis protein FlgA [Falsihalocynthiibacter arcticus]|uniref:Flagella basal body P-ring formation protein FlgA n=1 Tax=Falsihalocynthiibacter arcticus TaxID=1579316 RepID=A0A126V5J3_9RHOB|nr:flagellar basal body P-ring formation chaperone FlgA [Falsihalocynthiibacter arcticus]AML53562.1 flagellar biosynthesis protein FlgA [Falsihalocynthiibacter arcticus]
MKYLLFICALTAANVSYGETLVAARTIPSHTIISPADVAIKDGNTLGALTLLEEVIGQEARVAIYAGRPIRRNDIGAPALVERNQIVKLAYSNGVLNISVEARALGRGSAGDVLRFMNLDSRTTISGTVQDDGSILVTK